MEAADLTVVWSSVAPCKAAQPNFDPFMEARRVGANTEKALFLGPGSQNTLTDGFVGYFPCLTEDEVKMFSSHYLQIGWRNVFTVFFGV